MSQGLGAGSIDGSWVGQLQGRLARAGSPLRVVNLSVTGAGIADVLARQLPGLARLGDRVALVTVLAGANDMFGRGRRRPAVAAMGNLLAALPAGKSVVATLPRRNHAALAINALIDDAARDGAIAVADLRGMTVRSLLRTRAADLFHPNERGYAALADTFGRAMRVSGGCR
jgi:lysophospholipase L1-like esterase